MDPVSDKLLTEIRRLPLSALQHLETNARYMTADQQQRLTSNVKRDGGLTSLPLVWLQQSEDGTPSSNPPSYLIVSGNHRVISAREAELSEIDCIVILNWISDSRRVEIQLAHNAVSGQDDLAILEQLYEGLDLSGKEYSGLTDDLFGGLKDISLSGFNVDGPEYHEIVLTFLPEDGEQFEALVARAQKAGDKLFHTGRFDDFDKFFDAIVRTKEVHNVQNNAVALHLLAEMANERLDQIQKAAEQEAEAEQAQDQEGDGDVVE